MRSARLHATVGALGWAALVALWAWQAGGGFIPPDWASALAWIVGSTVALTGFSVGWVWWNRRIYRLRHSRRTPLVRPVAFDADALGRPIDAAPGADLYANEIVISIDPLRGRKRYGARRPEPTGALA